MNLLTKNKKYYLQATFKGKQRQVALGTSKASEAKERARLFMETAATTDFETAKEELTGKPVLKPGAAITHETIAALYRAYCATSAKAPRESTIDHNLARLKVIMKRAGATVITDIDKDHLFQLWHEDKEITPQSKRTFSSAVRAADSVFKKAALTYYASKGHPVKSPFAGIELDRPAVKRFAPTAPAIRKTIWEDCRTELKPAEAMIILMALGIGMRRSEIEAARVSSFVEQEDNVLVHICEQEGFQTKAGVDDFVPIPKSLYADLLELREKSKAEGNFFVPSDSKKESTGRLWETVKRCNEWLKKKGFNGSKGIHNLRKEFGTLVAKKAGIAKAAEMLRNTPAVAAQYYVGTEETGAIDMGASLTPKTKIEQAAEILGMDAEELAKLLQKKK